ncbi:putative protease [Paenibacillus phyllosphaerae]|uniref:Putative protease n=1 Tax=Paenibacillus phyllosphaerae TaxID=274593 RepID=A0A7W5AWU7_9BACL|nr:peptidase U32 family protein [Paenibacillus phyllosphaerae]MBB3109959.1 putative protease [Paenibacillus phyllosphaerae]
MATKPELITSASSLEELVRYMDAGADAFLLGEATYGVRMPGDFTIDMLTEAVKVAKPRGVKIYAALNNVMDNHTVASLPAYLEQLAQIGIDAIVFGDPAILMNARSKAPGIPLHWNAEMTSTNYATADYWGKRGATRVVLARELNMEQVLEAKAKGSLEVQVQVHGMTNIYHSKRPLVRNYMDHQKEAGAKFAEGDHLPIDGVPVGTQEDGMYLIEAERPEERFPIYEDLNGTHVMSSDDLCMIENLHELMEGNVDSFRIEPILKSVEYNEVVIRAYRSAIDAYYEDPDGYEFNEEWLEAIQDVQDPKRELSYGFFYKEQVY